VTNDALDFQDQLVSNDPSIPIYNAEVPEDIRIEDALISVFDLAISPDRIRVVPVEEMFSG